MRQPLFVSLLLITPLLVASGCSLNHGSHGDDHHDGESDSHGHGDEDHHDSSIGSPGDAESVDRVISVSMDDTMNFVPENFEVNAGETIQFDVVNNGKLVHEFVLGSTEELLEHHAMMKKFPGMEHDDPNAITLQAEASGSVIWTFDNAGVVDIACLVPGHFEAGMKGTVSVVAP